MNKYEELKQWAGKLDTDQLFGWSQDTQLAGHEKSFLYKMASKLKGGTHISLSQLERLEKLYAKQTRPESSAEFQGEGDFLESEESNSKYVDTKHLCLRLAWHDSAWNGRVCRNPEDNVYCVGEHSLLSDRIRRRRDLEVECGSACAGCVPNMKQLNGYVPPCFWSINAFGKETLNVEHDNPVAPEFPKIPQELPPYSVISWPFKLAFVKDSDEKRKYGNYYPKPIFEKRIKRFQAALEENASIVFLYCKFSNPISGEDMDYLVSGCALLSEKEPMRWFDVDENQLQQTADRLSQPNFPSLNWALRYSLDVEGSGVRLPYHEYLELANKPGGISEDLIKDMAVTVDEPELVEGFTYVAKHIDDDQAIYLLMKMRKSLFSVRDHDLVSDYDCEGAITTIDMLLEHAWTTRGYFPGLKNLLLSIEGIEADYSDDVLTLIDSLDCADVASFNQLVDAFESGESEEVPGIEGLLDEIQEFLDFEGLSAEQLLRLGGLTLTKNQYRRLSKKGCRGRSLSDIADNLYLLYEEYEQGDELEDKHSGEKVDNSIDLFRVDLAMLPHVKYLKKIKAFHTLSLSDPRRLRAVVIDVLRRRERTGDCYLEAAAIQKEIENYPLFYKAGSEYVVKEDLRSPSEDTEGHLVDKIVFRDLDGVRVYYLKDIYDDECFVANTISGLLEKESLNLSIDQLYEDIQTAATDLSDKIGESFDVEQFLDERKELYSGVLNRRIYVLTGSPGSGKSYELLKVIQAFNNQSEVTRVLTLTGKAALRLRKNEEGFGGINASTIDKFLAEADREADQGATSITHNLVIDEASMVDLPKLARLLRVINTSGGSFKRLILVGDENQLPPIGFGKPFADIIDFLSLNRHKYTRNMICLDTNCRAELPSEYIEFAKSFSNSSKAPEDAQSAIVDEGSYFSGGLMLRYWRNRDELLTALDSSTQQLIDDAEEEVSDVSGLLGIASSGQKRPTSLSRFQILTPNRTGFYGASGLNLHYQDIAPEKYLNGKIGEVVFKLHDKVMHTRNEYQKNELFVSNGSMGAIVGNQKIFFEEHDTSTRANKLRHRDHLELAYAITVHKSQGSGFNHVLIVLPERSRFISRELFYTALTRTKNQVSIFLQRSDDAGSLGDYFESIRKNSAILHRRTTLLIDDISEYAYVPIKGVEVRSRVEYIIYRKLLEARDTLGGFSFQFEEKYEVHGSDFNFHPDFVLRFDDGRVVYWEHLGLITKRSYLRGWDSRLKVYRSQGDYDSIMTTDELAGIDNIKIDSIIQGLIKNSLETEDDSNRFSSLHVSLR